MSVAAVHADAGQQGPRLKPNQVEPCRAGHAHMRLLIEVGVMDLGLLKTL